MKTRKVPVRQCLGCRTPRPKRELIRVVRSPEGAISVDFSGKKNGRGAYICRDKACLTKARKTKSLERTFECAISDEVYTVLEQELSDGE